MVAIAELIRSLLVAHFNGDDATFRSIVESYIDSELLKQHHSLAKELSNILNKTESINFPSKKLSILEAAKNYLPHDRERGILLVEVREARRELESLVLDPSVKETLDRVIEHYRKSDLLKTYGLKPTKRVLFCGPPGCGKTIAAEALARALNLPLVLVRLDAVVSSYLGETSANLRKVFDFARSRPMVLFLDEFDAIGKHRAAEEEHGELKRVVTSLLQMLDSFQGETLTVAASNHQNLLDPALWRRFDEVVFFDKPTELSITQALILYLRQIGLSADINLAKVSRSLLGMSYADIERISLDAVKQVVLQGKKQITAAILSESINHHRQRLEVTSRLNGKPTKQINSRKR